MRQPPLVNNIFSRHESKLPHLEYQYGRLRLARGIGLVGLKWMAAPYVSAAQNFVRADGGTGLQIFGLRERLANSECVQSLRQLTEEHDIGEWTLRDDGDTHYMSADLWMGGKAVA